MFCIHASFQAQFLPAVRVFDGDVILARPVDFQPGLLQGHEHLGTVGGLPQLHLGLHVFVNGLLGGGSVIRLGRLAPAQQPRPVQIRMGRRVHAHSGRVVRSGPAFAVVVQIAEQVKMLLPAGRARVERFAAGKLHTRNHKVQLVMPGMNVPHPEDIALIRLQPGKGQSLKIVHNALLLLRRHRVVGVP